MGEIFSRDPDERKADIDTFDRGKAIIGAVVKRVMNERSAGSHIASLHHADVEYTRQQN